VFRNGAFAEKECVEFWDVECWSRSYSRRVGGIALPWRSSPPRVAIYIKRLLYYVGVPAVDDHRVKINSRGVS
jgi:hypothetical protein